MGEKAREKGSELNRGESRSKFSGVASLYWVFRDLLFPLSSPPSKHNLFGKYGGRKKGNKERENSSHRKRKEERKEEREREKGSGEKRIKVRLKLRITTFPLSSSLIIIITIAIIILIFIRYFHYFHVLFICFFLWRVETQHVATLKNFSPNKSWSWIVLITGNGFITFTGSSKFP